MRHEDMSKEQAGAIAALLLTAVVWIALVAWGCGAPGVNCPLGSYPVNAAAERTAKGDTGGGASVPTASGNVKGTWDTAGRSTWSCKRLCPKGTALDLLVDGKRRQVRCLPAPGSLAPARAPEAGRDGGPGGDGSSGAPAGAGRG